MADGTPPRGALHGPFYGLPAVQPIPEHGAECAVRSRESVRQRKKREIIHEIAYNLACDDGTGKPCAICRVNGKCAPIKLELRTLFGIDLEVPNGIKWIAAPTKQQRRSNTGPHAWPSWIYHDIQVESVRESRKRGEDAA